MWLYIRLCLFLCFLTVTSLFSVACTQPVVCSDTLGSGDPNFQISNRTDNPNGFGCQTRCDCNNQSYEGYCINGTCKSEPRLGCIPGTSTPCQLPDSLRKDPNAACDEWGTRICQPDYIKLPLQGDCHPYTPEEAFLKRCTNGKDDDCNGLIDDEAEGCKDFCREKGSSRTCYPEPLKDKLNQGICRTGIQQCGTDNKWGTCERAAEPKEETCNNQDDDCDGNTDEGLTGCATTAVCKDGDTLPCFTEALGCKRTGNSDTFECTGTCKTGTRTCKGGVYGTCEGQTPPAAEACGDNLDNNCNGLVDEVCECKEGDFKSCYLGPQGTETTGLCTTGSQECIGGRWRACEGTQKPQVESCDNKDNDCDGKVDEGCACKDGQTQSCSTLNANQRNIGDCRDGQQVCYNGSWSECLGEAKPSKEICDNRDNDCNGQIDEGCDAGTNTECRLGFVRVCYTGSADTLNVGQCRQGFQSCTQGPNDPQPKLGACIGDVTPKPELCNEKDDDCDGKTDEECVGCELGTKKSCYNGPAGTEGKGICKAGQQVCIPPQDGAVDNMWSNCVGEVQPSTEIAGNNLDDDCDGMVDNVTAQPEVCDGKDNDMNGTIDDNACPSQNFECAKARPQDDTNLQCFQKCTTLSFGAPSGECPFSGQRYCTSKEKADGTYVRVCGGPLVEICNGADDDYDRSYDEGTCPTDQECAVSLDTGTKITFSCVKKCTSTTDCSDLGSNYICEERAKGDGSVVQVCVVQQ
ncbi:MAG: hypothetical protein H6727_18685 [Myxococcales bacterium]|nr:hypothetical protein [Myxococcales bacterium]